MSDKPFYRHQVHEIPPPLIDLTEYRLYSGKCTQCGEAVKAQKLSDIPQGIMGPNLMSHIAILAGEYHLSVRKIRSLLQEQFGTAYFHPSRSPNNIHRDRLIPFMEITNYHR